MVCRQVNGPTGTKVAVRSRGARAVMGTGDWAWLEWRERSEDSGWMCVDGAVEPKSPRRRQEGEGERERERRKSLPESLNANTHPTHVHRQRTKRDGRRKSGKKETNEKAGGFHWSRPLPSTRPTAQLFPQVVLRSGDQGKIWTTHAPHCTLRNE